MRKCKIKSVIIWPHTFRYRATAFNLIGWVTWLALLLVTPTHVTTTTLDVSANHRGFLCKFQYYFNQNSNIFCFQLNATNRLMCIFSLAFSLNRVKRTNPSKTPTVVDKSILRNIFQKNQKKKLTEYSKKNQAKHKFQSTKINNIAFVAITNVSFFHFLFFSSLLCCMSWHKIIFFLVDFQTTKKVATMKIQIHWKLNHHKW